jgi:hypothetical protein
MLRSTHRGYLSYETVLQQHVIRLLSGNTPNWERICLEEWWKWLEQKEITESIRIIEIAEAKLKVKKVSQWVIILKCPYLCIVISASHAIGTNNIARKQSLLTPPYSLVIFPHPDSQQSNYMKMCKHWDTFLSHCSSPVQMTWIPWWKVDVTLYLRYYILKYLQ